MNTDRLTRINQLREVIMACKHRGCHDPNPRHSTGGREKTSLVLIGQNPPSGPNGEHGAFLLHYPDREKNVHEKLVYNLVKDFPIKEIYASQVVKCQTKDNKVDTFQLNNCKGHLRNEVQFWDDAPVLVFGKIAERTIKEVFGMPYLPMVHYVDLIGNTTYAYKVEVNGRFIFAPHPSAVGRFVDEYSWRNSIWRVFNFAKGEIFFKHQDYKFDTRGARCPECDSILESSPYNFANVYCHTCKYGYKVWYVEDRVMVTTIGEQPQLTF